MDPLFADIRELTDKRRVADEASPHRHKSRIRQSSVFNHVQIHLEHFGRAPRFLGGDSFVIRPARLPGSYGVGRHGLRGPQHGASFYSGTARESIFQK